MSFKQPHYLTNCPDGIMDDSFSQIQLESIALVVEKIMVFRLASLQLAFFVMLICYGNEGEMINQLSYIIKC